MDLKISLTNEQRKLLIKLLDSHIDRLDQVNEVMNTGTAMDFANVIKRKLNGKD